MIDANDTKVLVVHAESAHWRRRLGPLAWAAWNTSPWPLTQTAEDGPPPPSACASSPRASESPKTQPRAITVLAAAGLVTREHLSAHARSGYRLNLPVGLELCTRPEHHDIPLPREESGRCPICEDKQGCLVSLDSASSTSPVSAQAEPGNDRAQDSRQRVRSPTSENQGRLFPPAPTVPATSAR